MATPDTTRLRLGTCSWSTKDWVGLVYSPGTQPKDYIAEYARRFSTVEVDSTFYRVPAVSTIESWRSKTPNGFLFAAKAPQTITHEKLLEDCEDELATFLQRMSGLGDRLGPILFQFQYSAKRTGVTQDGFLERLTPFLELLPREGFQFVVEVRNKTWLNDRLFEVLRPRNVACALIDHPWMDRPEQLMSRAGIVTADFAYIRWLGDRRGIEKITTTWNESVIDRRSDVERWVPAIKDLLDRELQVFGYVNNHYSGHAPHDVAAIQDLLGERS